MADTPARAPRRRWLVGALTLALLAGSARGAEVSIPRPQGFVTDRAGVLSAATVTRLTSLLEELRAKTGAEIAVLTVDTTQPLDDFTYALRVAEAWKPGRKGEDTGVVFLVAVRDRKLRVLVGYGLEGILPDGLVGEIQDREVVPEFRAGRLDEGVWRGVGALANRIAEARHVVLTGAPPPRPRSTTGPILSTWVVVLLILVLLAFMLYTADSVPRARGRRRPGPGWGGGFDGGGWSGGFGGGGGGFDGFGGGSFGGGGAGRSW